MCVFLGRLGSSKPHGIRLRTVAASCLFSALWFPTILMAQAVPPDVQRQSEQIERQLREQLREQQERARQAAPVRPASPPLETDSSIRVPDLGVPCRDIRVTEITGATQLSAATVDELVAPYRNRCLASTDLERLLADITKLYVDRGYVTTRAYLPAQDLRTGRLVVQVVEGTIERFDVETPRSRSVHVERAFPSRPGDLLNLRDLEQGIDQINRLASNSAQLDLQPGSQPGQTVVRVTNDSRRPVSAFVSVDNLGTPSTGRGGASVTLSLDSPLGFNELMSITHRRSVPVDPGANSEVTALSISVPQGYTLWSLDASQTAYASTVRLQSGFSLLAEGRTHNLALGVDRVLYRDQGGRLSVFAKAQSQASDNFLAGQLLQVASRPGLVFAEVGLGGFTVAGGAVFNGRVAWVQGLPIFGGLKDLQGLPADAPRAQFRKLALDLGASSPLFVAGQRLQWSSQFSGQRAMDTLYGSQQIGIGGYSTVRGYLRNSLTGDSGAYWRNELAMPYQADIKGTPAAGRVYVAYDIGTVSNRAQGVPSGKLTGISLGASLQVKAASFEVFVSRASDPPKGFAHEGNLVGVRVSFSL